MNVLITFEYAFARQGYGGGHQIARGLARALARQGHDVHVVCSSPDELVAQRYEKHRRIGTFFEA